ncbi:MAG: MarR family winged helix-turn-helix transcriptional regulator [Candidatus Dormibacteria bacterium]
MPTLSATPALRTLVLEAIPEIVRVIEADVRKERLSVPLTVGQFRALKTIADGADTTSEVARRLILTLPTTSRMVDALVVRDLVGRVTGEADRRQITLSLTPTGKALVREFERRVGRRVDVLLAHLTERERGSLEGSLTALLGAARRFCGRDLDEDTA